MTRVFGIYREQSQADQSVKQLLGSPFNRNRISILMPGSPPSTNLNANGGAHGTSGVLTEFAALAIPGIGPFLAAGPFVGALAGIHVCGLIDSFDAMGIPENKAAHYLGHLKDGAILISLDCNDVDETTLARHILRRAGAQDISSHPSHANRGISHMYRPGSSPTLAK